MHAWRIATETPVYGADDLTGTGARVTGGRWNRKGSPVIYASTSIALACLETLVHLNVGGLPLNRYLVRLEIPDELWERRVELDHTTAPIGWDAEPAGMTSIDQGESWLAAAQAALLLVPSIVVPEERNILINPLHPDARAIRAVKLRKWLYDPRLV